MISWLSDRPSSNQEVLQTCSIQNLSINLVRQQTKKTVSSLHALEKLFPWHGFIRVPQRHLTPVGWRKYRMHVIQWRRLVWIYVVTQAGWGGGGCIWTSQSITPDFKSQLYEANMISRCMTGHVVRAVRKYFEWQAAMQCWLINATWTVSSHSWKIKLHTLQPRKGASSPPAGCVSSRKPSWVGRPIASHSGSTNQLRSPSDWRQRDLVGWTPVCTVQPDTCTVLTFKVRDSHCARTTRNTIFPTTGSMSVLTAPACIKGFIGKVRVLVPFQPRCPIKQDKLKQNKKSQFWI